MSDRSAPYAERLRVPVRWWVQGGLFVGSFWIALIVAVPLDVAFGIAALMTAILADGLLTYGRAKVVVKDGWLTAGPARIETRFVGDIAALDRVATRAAAGPQADARAYLLLRPYLPRAVRIEIEDTRDPTPYWLVSSRHPERLVVALNDARSHPPAHDDDHERSHQA